MDTQERFASATDTDAPLLTLPDVARLLAVSTRTVYRLVAQGYLTVIRITPDTPRLRRADVETFIARGAACAET